ncbi:hypothetical protein ABH944_006329 [Caballeronia udeis]|uniref:Lipoprotein n=1 Tax=Caballeronia udeis TaxID=1232866 RepID=A0ABW8MQP0_9BURK
MKKQGIAAAAQRWPLWSKVIGAVTFLGGIASIVGVVVGMPAALVSARDIVFGHTTSQVAADSTASSRQASETIIRAARAAAGPTATKQADVIVNNDNRRQNTEINRIDTYGDNAPINLTFGDSSTQKGSVTGVGDTK